MISMPRKVRHAVVNRLKPSIGRVRRLMNRWSCSMMLFRYLHWRRFERGRTSPSCRTASNATGGSRALAETCRQAVGDLQRLLSALPVDLLNWSDVAKRQGGRHP